MDKDDCKRCKGVGLLYREPDCRDYLGDYVTKDCPDCNGKGKKRKQRGKTVRNRNI